MDARDTVKLVTTQLGEKKVRTALTIVMVIIGVASIVALTSQTAGTTASIQKSLGSLGPTAILVTPTGKTLLTSADVAQISALPNVSSVTPIVEGSGTLTVDGENQSVTVIGVSANGLSQIMGNSTYLYQGSQYSDNSTPDSAIGYDVAFSSSSEPDVQQIGAGETGTLTISGSNRGSSTKIAIPITGVLDNHGTSLISVGDSIFFSLSYAELLLHKDSYSEILVKANSSTSVTALTNLLEVVYGDNARVTNTASLASTFSSITSSTTTLFIVIAGISLLVAAIGIMNVMLMSVSERIHDIGILKSIGFQSKDVLTLFMLQAVFIGVVGGILGLCAGVVASYAISYTGGLHSGPSVPSSVSRTSFTPGSGGFADRGGSGAGGAVFISSASGGASFASTSSAAAPSTSTTSTAVQPVFTLSVIAESIAVAIVISVIAGIYPAWKASKMEPIDALRTL